MEIKPKKCKGTGKAAGFGCGTMQLKRTYGLGFECGCYQDWLLNSDEGKNKIERSRIQGKKKAEKQKNKENREFKEKHKSIAKLIQEARKPFQEFIRLRDANDSCISCGQTNSEIWDAGHLYKAELYTGLIFLEDNCHKQCRKCNTFLNGNEGEYRSRLVCKLGYERVSKLDMQSKQLRTYKYTREELIKIKTHYQNECKRIKQGC